MELVTDWFLLYSELLMPLLELLKMQKVPSVTGTGHNFSGVFSVRMLLFIFIILIFLLLS